MLTLALRQDLIQRLRKALEARPFVNAMWLEGADALGKVDAYSDLDLWLDVSAGQEEGTFQVVGTVLQAFGSLDVAQERSHPDPLVQQRFYRSSGLPPFLFVDVCVQTQGRDVVFGPADAFLPLFDRAGVLRREASTLLNLGAEVRAILNQRWRHLLVEKELQREHLLEALAYYHREVLEPLVHLLRLRYCPGKPGYGLKHISTDLPADDLRRLEALYALTKPKELREGVRQVNRWLDQLTQEWP
ncbi:hypothetical protein Dcar01_03486 [Deinococcus carri]|uniref:Polymerase nucleotidyl transferase domain-containing protein n=1 Tax=Deinococcus carri TaxID=1211323 RepID=A0ABP9WBL5_9DEIO